MRCGTFLPLFLFIVSSCAPLAENSDKLPHVKEYDIVKPQKLGLRAKRSTKQTYPEEQQFALTIEGKNYTVHLEKNKNLLSDDYTVTHYLENGLEVTASPRNKDHCYYLGHFQDIEDSSISVGLCSGMRGFLRVGQAVYLIEPLGSSADGDHALYRQEHLRRNKRAACGHGNATVYDLIPGVAAHMLPSGLKSQPLMRPQRFVELFLVADNAEFQKFGKSMQKIEARMLEVANHVDKLYRPLNFRVMLVGLEVWSYRDNIDVKSDPHETLKNFLSWRKENLIKKKKHDNAQFITGVEFVGPTVGLAVKSTMCTLDSGAVNEDHNVNPIGVASTIAHEMGHNLGMSHDASQCTCGTRSPSHNCIMSDTVGLVYPEAFSGCSLTELREFVENQNPTCLLDVPGTDRLFGGPVCGNAFVEPGEQCDCGTVEECSDSCCNASTCQLAEGAECAQGECCQQCQIKPAGSLCRASATDCDLAEYCTGQSPHCPKDTFKMNGVPCYSERGYCYNGRCPTLQSHCTHLWGKGTQVALDVCFKQNIQGTKDAYCRKSSYGNQGCAPRDMKCGKIFCSGGSEFPITHQKATITLGPRVQCKIAVDNSDGEDLGMVPTGTKCGDKKVCLGHACQDIAAYGSGDCSAKCNNRGVCNHERQCHCDPGWAPPYCSTRLANAPLDWFPLVVGVSVTVVVILVLATGAALYHRRKTRRPYLCKTKCPGGSGLSNPVFQEGGIRDSPPQISQPMFMESTDTRALSFPVGITVIPSRPAPQSPGQPASGSAQVVKPTTPPPPVPQARPSPPTKPLPALNVRPTPPSGPSPPVPPAKPTSAQPPWKHKQVAVGRTAGPKPPPKPR
ncbi:disintegrin and metalloproteinase domain-containing protein 8a isoform X2 [Paramormyrops kingsleyae]|uniref:disintegrin and metalloproteinase domain-containing protein 8a isoform X2 n=1 Tax=Paramormyrops kingsleyae TaxID=1676925 RepID=UPI000CD5F8EB|nr:disintegrin and metalloproteinase domain-containing protein 8 isoform X2 [Paramormyrops kingsleyae]